MPKKLVRRGIKVWMRAAAESGYVSALEVYTGKERDNVEQGLDSKVVLSLTSSEEYLQTHSLTVSSAVLVFSLIFSKLVICHKRFKDTGKNMNYQHRNLTACVWQDTKPVVITATNFNPTTPTTVECKQGW